MITKLADWEFIQAELNRQETLWGEQNHSDFYWLAILLEEIGEVAQTLVEGISWLDHLARKARE